MSDDRIVMKMITANRNPIPSSFNGDLSLYGINLFLMTAMTFLGLMLACRQASRIWAQRNYDHPLDPVSLYRCITFLAALAVFLRCGAEALLLWGWSPTDVEVTKRVVMAKRWIDPLAVWCGILWMTIVMLGEPGIEHQLRKAPLPVDMWSRWPTLVRALGVLVLSMVMAFAAVILR
ncbi:hypothetical protein [Sphingomonas sp. MMS24-J13]|uniref:hypothetical protein n=1 Tax=Sphingomonas sp. MMS24-J13 TaxID=3238686 RepID=UPI00384C80F8